MLEVCQSCVVGMNLSLNELRICGTLYLKMLLKLETFELTTCLDLTYQNFVKCMHSNREYTSAFTCMPLFTFTLIIPEKFITFKFNFKFLFKSIFLQGLATTARCADEMYHLIAC